jgi:hypothetical protein
VAAEEIENLFTFHPASPKQVKVYEDLRGMARAFAHLLDEVLPPSDEKKDAIKHLDYMVMRANAAIARHS